MKNKHFNIICHGEIYNVKYLHKFKYYANVFVVAKQGIHYAIYDYKSGKAVFKEYLDIVSMKKDLKRWVKKNIKFGITELLPCQNDPANK